MSLIPDEIINQVLDRCQITEVIAAYIPLKRAGRNFKANCPFHHEKTPSFVVNPDKQIYHCFGCGVGGNVISFVMQQERIEFPEAVRILAQKVGVTIPERASASSPTTNLKQQIHAVNDLAATFFHQNLLSGHSSGARTAKEYLKGRKISQETAKAFRLGFAHDEWDHLISFLKKNDVSLSLMEKAGLIVAKDNKQGFYDRFRNRITFPIFDVRSQCVGFGARVLKDADSAKYINSPETPVYTKGNHLYGLNLAKDAIAKRDFVIVVEGYMDFIIPFQAGIDNVVASLGTALTVEQVRLLRRYTHNIVMLFDGDVAGESAMLRSLDLLIEEGMQVKVAALPQGEDPDSFITKAGVDAFNAKIAEAQTLFDYKLGRLMGRFNFKTIEGRAKIADEMLPTINRFANEVMKFGYTKQLAESLQVPEEALHKELKKKDSGMPSRSNAPITKQPAPKEVFRTVESDILKLLLEQGDLIPLTKDEVVPTDFRDEKVRSIITTIFDLFDKGKEVNASNLMNCFDDRQIQQMISGLLATENTIIGDKKKIHRDCLDRIKKDRQRLERQELTQQIRLAEGSGDHEKLDELTEKFNQLMKG